MCARNVVIKLENNMALIPTFKWAQDKENIYLTIEVENASETSITVTDAEIKFTYGRMIAVELVCLVLIG